MPIEDTGEGAQFERENGAPDDADHECGVCDGVRKVRKLVDPLLPSEEEVKNHCLTHVPFQNWCPHCVRGRGKEMDHKRVFKDERGLDEFHFDYCFPGDEFGFKIAVLVGVESYTGVKLSLTVPRKGSTGDYAALNVTEYINECGNQDADIIIKTDREPAMRSECSDIQVSPKMC